MGAMKYLIVQTLDEEERKFAEDALEPNGGISVSGAYVRGYGDDECANTLRERNLIVEQVPDEVSLNWLEPGDRQPAAELADAGESEMSPLRELAVDVPDVCVIQFAGPLLSKWRKKLDELGVELLSAKPGFAFKARVKTQSSQSIADLDFVKRVVRYDPGERYERLRKDTRRVKEHRQQVRQEERAAKSASSETETHYESLVEMAYAGDESEMTASAEDSAPNELYYSSAEGGAVPEPAASGAAGDSELASAETPGGSPSPTPTPTDDSSSAFLQYDVKTHLPEQINELGEALRADDRIKDVEIGRFKIRFSCEEDSPVLQELTAMTQIVSRVDPYIEPELTINCVRSAIGVATEDETDLLPWDGTGVLVGVADSGVDDTHPDLRAPVLDPVISRAGTDGDPDPKGHGTHVCGVIAGDGTASLGKLRGVAPGARLVVQGLVDVNGKLKGLPLEMGDLFQEAYDRGVRIHNDSWGHKVDGRYSIDSYEVDQFVYDHPDFLVVFSVGNDGKQTENGQSAVDKFGRILLMSVRSPATAKNALAVGACCSSRKDGPYKLRTWSYYNPIFSRPLVSDEPVCGDAAYLAAFSSRGPSDDERIKPDLVAPGTVIVSARKFGSEEKKVYEGSDSYQYMSGTSQAAPVVSGAAAIIRQYFSQEHHHEASAALLKATLINGTTWLTSQTAQMEVGQPNFHQGFGRLNLGLTLPNPNNPELKLTFNDVDRNSQAALNGAVPARKRWLRRIEVESGLPLLVTLAWTDKPGHGLQQNLDLTVVKPDGQKVYGNHRMQRPSWAPLDRHNNIQQVVIEDPQPGIYVVYVLAYNTPFENQGFSLVATGKLTTDLVS